MDQSHKNTKQLEEQLNGLGEQIAFKRADLPSLLDKQRECKEAIESRFQVDRIEAHRKEAVDYLKRRAFTKAQMALSECLKMLADIDLEEAETSTLQSDIAETKKVRVGFNFIYILVDVYKYSVG
jgi:prefoldin subunit 5